MVNKPQTTNSIDWLNGYHQALEDAADFVEQNVQTMTDPRVFMPRRDGNQYGLEYAKAILAMKDTGL